ncbi:hypothetical protein B0H10DRAFT_1942742 [Mycena sp. CBHHK59/15]|nr:hypothetical protein B0H10DRAFT_1942742 [Mycena sp. CBHHK59/15]
MKFLAWLLSTLQACSLASLASMAQVIQYTGTLPRVFPIKRPMEPVIDARGQRSTPTERATHSRTLAEEDRQFEQEFVRISLVQAHAPWTETRFAKYLTVEHIPDADVPLVACDTVPEEPAIRKGWQTRAAKRVRQAANQFGNDMLAMA